jgi:uncharacterized repeat protein (TIGR03803 family)
MTSHRKHSTILILGILTAVVLLSAAAAAVTEQVLYSFPGQAAAYPNSNLIFNAAGRLYGTVAGGGSTVCPGGCGSVFELSYNAGAWIPHGLYSFKGGSDGFYPVGNLVFDSAGSLYGVTKSGGAHGQGAVFRLTLTVGTWVETLIYSFQGGPDGSQPYAGLTMDSAGNLFGTTNYGGSVGVGTVYELSPAGGGSWTEAVLHSFGASGDGDYTWAEVTFDQAGNLYGTTVLGGTSGAGTVYELSQSGGVWTETVLYSFTGRSDAGIPKAPVWIDSAGNLFGTASDDGIGGGGAVFELMNSNGSWTERTLHKFVAVGDGSVPFSGLTPDSLGNLYGTTYVGGAHGAGTVYQIRPGSNGSWIESVVYSFSGSDGNGPHTGLTRGNGVLFGTTVNGGALGHGVIFQLSR